MITRKSSVKEKLKKRNISVKGDPKLNNPKAFHLA